MKISITIPTYNRLELLRYAIKTVLQQDYDDWELIISDNASEDNIEDYIISLGEPRIKYYRTSTFISVTENWNNALAKCEGDYVIMLGDDDGLMQGYLTRVVDYIKTWEYPDLIYHAAWLYAWPGVVPGYEQGYVHKLGCASFIKNNSAPFLLEMEEAKKYVEGSMNFKAKFDFNMQFALIKKEFIDSLGVYGSFYQSPYPDYYAMNAIFLNAKRILIVPQSIVAIGISLKSFGYYYCNQNQKKGKELLNNEIESTNESITEKTILPGSDIYNSWLASMEILKKNYDSLFDLHVNYERYRELQIIYTLANSGWRGLIELFPYMLFREKIFYYPKFIAMFSLKIFYRKKYNFYMNKILEFTRTYPLENPLNITGKFKNMFEVCREKPESLAFIISEKDKCSVL